ncbi:hypothetical protein CCACVL1_04896 [Corchorus capsularis]|uniref:F-box domain-containing protein n=1 Tax=Corchorus capsularis TaxID=210143 RepID=A0A1R3JPE0_COCAP|nr:hypothetical protein CCACVL1_04896 [Corchorus capsularis]
MATMVKSKKAKKNHEHEEAVAKDRLSDLPDCILHHILSFLPDIKFCVRTTLLSKRWNNLWACLPDLIFDNLWASTSMFKKFVRNVLNKRENLPVNKFTCNYYEKDKSFIATIINYAVSHNVQHFSIGAKSPLIYLSPLFNISGSLKTLDLRYFNSIHLLEDFTLPSLTTLSLWWCRFFGVNGNGELISIDPFVGLFNLKSLQLLYCSMGRVRNFKISGPQLDSLTMSSWYNYHCECEVEIVAPKLRFFSCESRFHPVKFSHLDFPLLEIADIRASVPYARKKSLLKLISIIFPGLYNAQTLVLPSDIIEGLMECPDVLEDRSSPFLRLKTLKVRYCSFNLRIPDNVIKYFCENITVEDITIF